MTCANLFVTWVFLLLLRLLSLLSKKLWDDQSQKSINSGNLLINYNITSIYDIR